MVLTAAGAEQGGSREAPGRMYWLRTFCAFAASAYFWRDLNLGENVIEPLRRLAGEPAPISEPRGTTNESESSSSSGSSGARRPTWAQFSTIMNKWTRMYVRRGPNSTTGDTALLIARVSRVRSDGNWTAVFPNRSVFVIDTKDRVLVTARKMAGCDYTEFPVMTRVERSGVEDASKDLILQREQEAVAQAARDAARKEFWNWNRSSVWKKAVGAVGVAQSAMMAMWATRILGSTGLMMFCS